MHLFALVLGKYLKQKENQIASSEYLKNVLNELKPNCKLNFIFTKLYMYMVCYFLLLYHIHTYADCTVRCVHVSFLEHS